MKVNALGTCAEMTEFGELSVGKWPHWQNSHVEMSHVFCSRGWSSKGGLFSCQHCHLAEVS